MKTTLQTRRKFMRTSMLGAAATWTLPVFLEKTFFTLDAMAADALTQTVTGKDGSILVVLQLAGGNDGLNMVVPSADEAYHRARTRLGTLDFLQRTALDAQLSSDKILAIARKYKSTVAYPQGPLAASLSIIARMIA